MAVHIWQCVCFLLFTSGWLLLWKYSLDTDIQITPNRVFKYSSFSNSSKNFLSNDDNRTQSLFLTQGLKDFKYSAVIVEPRKHPALRYVLQNFLENLSDEWIIIILYGTNNHAFIENIINTSLNQYTNRIRKHSLNVSHYDLYSYNDLLLREHFYEFIPTDIHLIFQVDTIICAEHKDLINSFLKYDYVGAPWLSSPVKGYGEFHVGNGGLSLRKKHKLLDKFKNCPLSVDERNRKNKSYLLEDVYFSQGKYCNLFKPSKEEAKLFCMEGTFSEISFGIHQVWGKHNLSMINKKMDTCQALKELYKLSVKPKARGFLKYVYSILLHFKTYFWYFAWLILPLAIIARKKLATYQ